MVLMTRHGEVTLDVRDMSASRRDLIEGLATDLGYHVSGDGKYILVRRHPIS